MKLLDASREQTNDLEQVAREIYYALSYMEEFNPGSANLKRALEIIGVTKPKDIGLSKSVLNKRPYQE